MSYRAASAVFFLVILAGGAALTGKKARNEEPIQRLISRLADDNFKVREEATLELWNMGTSVEEALEDAAASASTDLETARRATQILERFRHGDFPNLSPAIRELVGSFRADELPGSAETWHQQRNVVKKLTQEGHDGCLIAMRLAALVKDKPARTCLFSKIRPEANQLIARHLAEGNSAKAEELLKLSVTLGAQENAPQNYALVLFAQGRIESSIRKWKARMEKFPDAHKASLLAELYRLHGDWAQVNAVSKGIDRDGPTNRDLLKDQQRWTDLLKDHEQGHEDRQDDIDDWLPTLAGLQRLAGLQEELNTSIGRIRTHVPEKFHEKTDLWYVSKALILNERPELALKALVDQKNHSAAIDFLCAQMRYREAFELVDKEGGKFRHSAGEKADWAIILHRLGEKDKAVAILDELSREIPTAKEPRDYGRLVIAEQELGLRSKALRDFAQILSRRDKIRVDWLWQELFPEHGQIACSWWQFLRESFPKETTAVSMERVSDLFDKRTKANDSLLDEAEQFCRKFHGRDQSQWLDALAQIHLIDGDKARCRQYLEQAAKLDENKLMALADFLASEKCWRDAATTYARLRQKCETNDPNNHYPLVLFLEGWSNVRAGNDSGTPLMEQAHWIHLGATDERWEFAKELEKRGFTEAANREHELILRTRPMAGWKEFNGNSDRAQRWERKQEYNLAAACWERHILCHLGSGTAPMDQGALLRLPWFVHCNRARGHLATGSVDEAIKEANLCMSFLPGEVELPISLVPGLQKLGHAHEADKLFDRVFALYEKFCADFPRCAWGHNNLAWLAARCRRRLDVALIHAEKAVALEPGDTNFLGTLAEVRFQRGEKSKALKLVAECIETQRDEKNKDFLKAQKKTD